MSSNMSSIEFNYDHLKPLEAAARIYCAMNDQDADENMKVPHPMLEGVPFFRPAWHFAAEALLNLNQMLVALRQAQLGAGAPKQADAFPGH